MSQTLVAPQQASAAPKERIAYFDNVRFWLILLVVVGHALGLLTSFMGAEALYLWIYCFHMPAFIIITGYLSKNFTWTGKAIRKTVETLLWPYLLFEVSTQLLTMKLEGEPSTFDPLTPPWIGWFLMALFLWRLLTPLLLQLKYPLLTAVTVSLAMGLFEAPPALAIHKTLSFLPFYVLGLKLKQEHFERLQTPAVRVVAGLLLAGTLGLSFLLAGTMSSSWLKWKRAYEVLGVNDLEGVGLRLLLLGVCTLLSFAVFALVPWGRTRYSAMGGRTLYAYFFHGYIIITATALGYFSWVSKDWAGTGLTMGFAALVGLALLTPHFEKPMKPILSPSLRRFFLTRH